MVKVHYFCELLSQYAELSRLCTQRGLECEVPTSEIREMLEKGKYIELKKHLGNLRRNVFMVEQTPMEESPCQVEEESLSLVEENERLTTRLEVATRIMNEQVDLATKYYIECTEAQRRQAILKQEIRRMMNERRQDYQRIKQLEKRVNELTKGAGKRPRSPDPEGRPHKKGKGLRETIV